MSDEKKPIRLVILPERINLVFADYDEGVVGFELAAAVFHMIEGTDLQGSVRLSFDNGSKNPIMSLIGPKPVIDGCVNVLAELGTRFAIDPSSDDIVARKFNAKK